MDKKYLPMKNRLRWRGYKVAWLGLGDMTSNQYHDYFKLLPRLRWMTDDLFEHYLPVITLRPALHTFETRTWASLVCNVVLLSTPLSWSRGTPRWRWGATGRWRRRWTSPASWRCDTWRWTIPPTCESPANALYIFRVHFIPAERSLDWSLNGCAGSECCGALECYDKAFDRITTRNEKQLRSIKRIFHTVTTTDDPVIRKVRGRGLEPGTGGGARTRYGEGARTPLWAVRLGTQRGRCVRFLKGALLLLYRMWLVIKSCFKVVIWLQFKFTSGSVHPDACWLDQFTSWCSQLGSCMMLTRSDYHLAA